MAQDTNKNGMVVPVNGGSKRAKVEESSGKAKKNENTESRVCVDGELPYVCYLLNLHSVSGYQGPFCSYISLHAWCLPYL